MGNGHGWGVPVEWIPEVTLSGSQRNQLVQALGRLGRHVNANHFIDMCQEELVVRQKFPGRNNATPKGLRNHVAALGAAVEATLSTLRGIKNSGDWYQLAPLFFELVGLEKYQRQYRIPSALHYSRSEKFLDDLEERLLVLASFKDHATSRLAEPSSTDKPERQDVRGAIINMAGFYERCFDKRPSGSKETPFVRFIHVLMNEGTEVVRNALKRRAEIRAEHLGDSR